MPYTLKKKNTNKPFFIQEDGVSISINPTEVLLEYNSLTDLAIDFINGKFKFENGFNPDWCVSKSDVVSLNAKKNKFLITKEQDFKNNIKFINADEIKNCINFSRITRMYLKNKEIPINDLPEDLIIIGIPKSEDFDFKVGDKLIYCSHYTNTFFDKYLYQIFDDVNLEELYENRNIDTEKYKYLIINKIDDLN
jgi:hypothetical protein